MKKNKKMEVISKVNKKDFIEIKKRERGEIFLVYNIAWKRNYSLPKNILIFISPDLYEYWSRTNTEVINKYLYDNYHDIALEYEYI